MKPLACLLLLFATTGIAHADRASARQAFERGLKQYNLADYDGALASFTAAYNEFSEPTLLFNLAQCHRQLGNKQKALSLYRNYLRETKGTAPNAVEVRRLIAMLEQEVQREQMVKQVPPQELQTPTGTTAATTPPSEPAPSEPPKTAQSDQVPVYKKWWLWTVVGVVVVGVAVGVGLGVGLSQPRFSASIPDVGPGTGGALTVSF